MTRSLALLAILLLLAAAAPAAGGPAGDATAPERVVVGAADPSAARALAARLRSEGADVEVIPRLGALEVATSAPAALRHRLRADRRVEFVEPVLWRRLSAEPAEGIDPATGRPFGWAYEAVMAGGALAAVGGGSSAPVAVLDSGIDADHPDLAGRIGAGVDIAGGGSPVRDGVGHGTFVAGLIGAIDGNGRGGRGVAGATTLLPVRITAGEDITSSASAAGIVWAVDHGARVINLSYGGPSLAAVEAGALEYARSRDVLVVAAAGNTARLRAAPNEVQYPAAAIGGVRGGWSAGLSVAATTPSGAPASFSTSNDFVSIAAPGAGAGPCGDGVFSTVPGNAATLWDGAGDCAPTFGTLGDADGRYGYGEGTSFATPIVAGAAALVRQANPALRADQAADVLRRTARQSLGAGWNARTGAGIVDMAAAVGLARRYDTVPPAPSLAAAPEGAAVAVQLAGGDAAPPGADPAGVVSYSLERSRDGVAYTSLVPAQAAPVAVRDAAPAGEVRWYRGTLCDANRNCATAVRGPVFAATLAGVGVRRPALRSAAVRRPARCPRGRRACLRIAVRIASAEPATLAIAVRQAGRARVMARRAVRVGAGARARAATLVLPAGRACARALRVTITLRSAAGASAVDRRVPRGRACRRR